MSDSHKNSISLKTIDDLSSLYQQIDKLRNSYQRTKKIEDVLRKHHKLIFKIFDTADFLLVLSDPEQKIVRFNRACQQITGLTFSDVKNKPLLEILHFKDLSRKCISVFNNNGDEKVVEWVNTEYFNNKGQIEYIISAGIDITDRVVIEKALDESEYRYHALFNDSTDALYISTRDGRFVDVNSSMVNLMGYSKKELMSMDILNLYADSGMRRVFQQEIETKGALKEYEISFRKKDGTVIDCLLTATLRKSRNGIVEGYQGIIRDITEKKRIGKAILRAKQEWEMTFDSIADLIMIIDNEHNVLRINRAMARKLNIEPKEAVGKKCYHLVHEQDSPIINCPHLILLSDCDEKNIELAVDRFKRQYLLKITPFYNAQQQLSGTVHLFRDITEIKNVQKELESSLLKLNRVLDETVTALSSALEKRDPYTVGHQQRVAYLASAIAKEMKLQEDHVHGVRMAALIHDIGKIYIPIEILSKPRKLNDIEYSMIKTHSQLGHDILKGVEFKWPVSQAVLQHHERINGTGYPNGVSDRDILIDAKILAVADVVEAMASYRPYRPALGLNRALDEIRDGRSSLYDKDVVDACLYLFDKKEFHFLYSIDFPVK